MHKNRNVFEFVSNHPLSSLVVGGVIIIVGLLFSSLPKMIASQGWPTTKGIILKHKLVGQRFKEYDGDFYEIIEVSIRYQYSVDGIIYTSQSINLIDTPLNLYPSKYADQYPEGKDAIVYYNPNLPSEAVLEPGIVNVLKAIDVYTCIFLGVGTYFIYQGISRIQAIRDRKRREKFIDNYKKE